MLFHGGPGAGNIAGPGGGGGALLAGVTGAREDEDALIGLGGALAVVDGLAFFERVGVEHARPGAVKRWVHVGALAVEGGLGKEIRFGGIKPPGVRAFVEERGFHLLPEELLRFGIEGVEEGVGCAEPIRHIVLERMRVEESLRLHRVEIVCAWVEFSPDGDHEVGVLFVDGFDPAFGIGEAIRVEFVGAPLAFRPIAPILDDVIERNVAGAEAVDDFEAGVGGFVALAGLPEAEDPDGHHGCRAGELAIAGDDIVDARAVDEIVVDAVAHFGPEGSWGVGISGRGFPLKVNVRALLAGPIDFDGARATGFEVNAGEVFPGEPTLAPVVHDEVAVDPDFDVAVGEGLELVIAGGWGKDGSLPADGPLCGREAAKRRIGLCGRGIGGSAALDMHALFRPSQQLILESGVGEIGGR